MLTILNEQINVVITAKSGDEVICVREGHNVWTNAGREFSCLKKVRKAASEEPIRTDYIEYVGLGTGTQPETVDVNSLVTPIAFSGNFWLKQIDHLRTAFVDPASRASVRFFAEFSGAQMLDVNNAPFISECGLFTSAHSDNPDAYRSVILDDASRQIPVAYHTFQPIPMNNTTSLEIVWELRH